MIIEIIVHPCVDAVDTLAKATVVLQQARDTLARRGRQGREFVAVYGPRWRGQSLAYRVTDEGAGRVAVWRQPGRSGDGGEAVV